MALEEVLPEVEHGAPDQAMPPWADGGLLPSFAHVAGRNVALVDAGEYRALLALAEAVSDPERARAARAAVVAKIEGDAVGALPAVERIGGVELVTLPREHYAELLDCRRLVAEAGIARWRYTADTRSRVERDPEVATFLTEAMGTCLLKDAHALCRERFGAERTPGQSTIQRFWKRLGKR